MSKFFNINEKISLTKNATYVSFQTYIMTVHSFGDDRFLNYNPLINNLNYKPKSYLVCIHHNKDVYCIDDKELYENVVVNDKVVGTIKCFYDCNENLIHSDIHKVHPFPIYDI